MPLKNNTHTYANKKYQELKRIKIITRVHYTVLTQHNHPPHQQQPTQDHHQHNKQPQESTPQCIIPDTQQHANTTNNTSHNQHNTQQHTITQPCTATNCKQHTITHNTDPPGLKKINNKHQPVPIEKQKLLRKEVIQPHLPVRLPCYDFVPIADPTFDHSPQKLVGPWASGVTNFHDVTGGVYKARERIHRSVADLRLLATPTSWGRVADPNPN